MKGEYNLTIQLLSGNEEFELAYVPPDIFGKLRYIEGRPAVFTFINGQINVWPTSDEYLQVRLNSKVDEL